MTTPRTDGGTGRQGPHLGRMGGVRRGVDFFTTNMVAELIGVAPRTVCKWIDKGTLPGLRLPRGDGTDRDDGATADRRVYRDDLLAFARRRGLRLPGWLAGQPVACLTDDGAVFGVQGVDPLGLGVLLGRCAVSAVLVGCGHGLLAAVRLGQKVRAADPAVRLALLRADDVAADAVPAGVFDAAFGACEAAAAAAWAAGRG